MKDKRRNKEGRTTLKRIKEVTWTIFNGNIERDREEEWTFTEGRGEAVIDYVIGSLETKEIIEGMVVEDCIDSDHHPLMVQIERGDEEQRKRGRIGRTGRWV